MHVAVSYNSPAGMVALYVKGQNVTNGLASIPSDGINDVNVWLGRSQWNDPYFNGQFDEFRIFSDAVSDPAVAASFVAGPNALFQGLPSIDVGALEIRFSCRGRSTPRALFWKAPPGFNPFRFGTW